MIYFLLIVVQGLWLGMESQCPLLNFKNVYVHCQWK